MGEDSFRLPKTSKHGDRGSEFVTDTHDYKRNIFNQIDRICNMGNRGLTEGFINAIKQLRFMLISYIARDKTYLDVEKKIQEEYKKSMMDSGGDNNKKKRARYIKYQKIYIQLQILIGDTGFLPELSGEFIEGENFYERTADKTGAKSTTK